MAIEENGNGKRQKQWIERLAIIALSAGLGGGSAEWHHGDTDAQLSAEISSMKGEVDSIVLDMHNGNVPMSNETRAAIDAINRHLEATDTRVDRIVEDRRTNFVTQHRESTQ